ncbi:odorant receptor 131-2-like [Rhinoderma darwinii]|uniref:odorant receptor 131-2-like n=1 Tax=Rhinoderma darwinii TaxID=43563 RepID=UPI003F679E67
MVNRITRRIVELLGPDRELRTSLLNPNRNMEIGRRGTLVSFTRRIVELLGQDRELRTSLLKPNRNMEIGGRQQRRYRFLCFTCISRTQAVTPVTGPDLAAATPWTPALNSSKPHVLPEFQMNSTGGERNASKVSLHFNMNIEVLRMTVLVPTFLCFFFFLYFIAVMLSIYFKSWSARESARYVLFAHMLINDTIYLALGLFLFVLYFYPVTFPVPFCHLLVTMSSTSLKVTPYTLAVMSLERYIAICYPLRHGAVCTVKRCGIAILVIWTIGLIPNIADFIIVISMVERTYFLLHVKCSRITLSYSPAQDSIRVFANAFTFSSVGLVIIFTYARIMMVTLKIDPGQGLASKAGKTIMLHAFQLLLCMTSFTYRIVEMQFLDNIVLSAIINFCFFMCLPRLISPLIYGIRDELFSSNMKRYFLCNYLKIFPRMSSK